MQDKTDINLVSSEVAGLWTTYISDTMAICTLKHFLNTLHDGEIRHILQQALNTSNGHIRVISEMFEKEGLPIPKGFNQDDVDMNAPKLFTDPFFLFYLISMGQLGMMDYTLILNHIARPDVMDFFSTCIHESVQLFNTTANALQNEGLFIKAPRVEFTKHIDFIDNQNFFSGGWITQKRNMTGREITAIFASTRFNIIGSALLTGFGQVTKYKTLSDYFFKGVSISKSKVEALDKYLADENIPIPSTSDSFVTDSTTPPFSDKLMLFHTVLLTNAGIMQDSSGFANAMRHDLQLHFAKSVMETAKYAEDGVDILIRNKWMEQPPQTIEHRKLAKV
jgi:hypothetical protein